MADAVQESQQEFWRSPTLLGPLTETVPPAAPPTTVEACADCATEFMIGARFCHKCGSNRPISNRPMLSANGSAEAAIDNGWDRTIAWSAARVRSGSAYAASTWRKISFPAWMRYLHFHEIQRAIGLPTASLIAFITGLGCVAGAIGVSLFYKASNMAEFQAIQMWRIEWLLAATAAFVAGILLKKPSE
jgi:hypothetical protein